MSHLPPFLARLGLDQGAGASEIEQAYARELALIDQERDAAGVEALRTAYAAALQWATLPRPAADADAAAAEAFARFTADFAAMMRAAGAQLAACRAVLERALGQPALRDIDARTGFERRLVHLLAAGWKPGHEFLLVVASAAFAWSGEQRRLAEFGDAGQRLSQAIDERNRFDAQPHDDQLALGQVVGALRSDAAPDTAQLLRSVAHLDALEARFPAWLAMVTNAGRIAHWRDLERKIPAWRRRLTGGGALAVPQPSHATKDAGGARVAWFGVFIVILMLRAVFQQSAEPPPNLPVDVGVPLAEPRVMEIAAILKLVRYQAPPDLRDYLMVEFEIELDDQGRARKVAVLRPSQDPAYDAAVTAAILAAPAFSAKQPRRFRWTHFRPKPAS